METNTLSAAKPQPTEYSRKGAKAQRITIPDSKSSSHVRDGAGEILLFDKAYVDFEHIFDLDERGVFWVSPPRTTCNTGA